MLRMIFVSMAAIAVGSIGGLMFAALPVKDPAPPLQSTSLTRMIEVPSPRQAAPAQAPITAPKPIAAAAPPAPPAPAPASRMQDKPRFQSGGKRVSVRTPYGTFKFDL
jgi:hypothetical protein